MAYCILIDTSTERGIIALSMNGEEVFRQELPFGLNQSKFLLPLLSKVLNDFSLQGTNIESIGVGVGPGSYTGIRIGVSVSQAFAYAWKVPLIEIPTLCGFVPFEKDVKFAAVIDARIGGVYLQIGQINKDGQVIYEKESFNVSLEEGGDLLKTVKLLVTPNHQALKAKFDLQFPENGWKWVERAPCVSTLLIKMREKKAKGEVVISPEKVSILYLRETEAERSKKF